MNDLGSLVAEHAARQLLGCAAVAALVGLLVGVVLVWVLK
jgi:uncharacterized iron-regulated membrane protein